jgi:hypothetical protein
VNSPHKAGICPLDCLNSGHKRTSTPLGFPIQPNVPVPCLNMTPRSPHRPHPKTTTISRRLRNRADQTLYIQPPEIPRLRSVRPRRAATLPQPHHEPLESRRQQSQKRFEDWDTEDLGVESQISRTSNCVEVGAHHQSVNILAQRLETSPHVPLQSSIQGLVSTEPRVVTEYQQLQYPTPEFPPSPHPSVSGSLDFGVPFSATDPRQSQNPYIDLQDMR